MGNSNRKIVTIVIGLAGMVGTGQAVAGLGSTQGQSPARVTHLADMHWINEPGEDLPDDVSDLVEELVPGTSPEDDDDMHW